MFAGRAGCALVVFISCGIAFTQSKSQQSFTSKIANCEKPQTQLEMNQGKTGDGKPEPGENRGQTGRFLIKAEYVLFTVG